jgi:hypothetical protein
MCFTANLERLEGYYLISDRGDRPASALPARRSILPWLKSCLLIFPREHTLFLHSILDAVGWSIKPEYLGQPYNRASSSTGARETLRPRISPLAAIMSTDMRCSQL